MDFSYRLAMLLEVGIGVIEGLKLESLGERSVGLIDSRSKYDIRVSHPVVSPPADPPLVRIESIQADTRQL